MSPSLGGTGWYSLWYICGVICWYIMIASTILLYDIKIMKNRLYFIVVDGYIIGVKRKENHIKEREVLCYEKGVARILSMFLWAHAENTHKNNHQSLWRNIISLKEYRWRWQVKKTEETVRTGFKAKQNRKWQVCMRTDQWTILIKNWIR